MGNATGPIIAIGDLVWDVLVKPYTMLLPGGDTTGRIALAPGGSAANVATWIARVGMPAGFVGKVGADVFGDLVVGDLEREQVAAYVSRTTEHDTGVILVLIDRAGQRSMVTNQAADFQLMPADLPLDALRASSHVHITAWSLFTDPPRAAALRAAQVAKAAGATVSFDPASYQMIREMGHDRFARITAALPVDILFPNREEGQALTGEHAPEQIAQELFERHNGAVIVLKLDKDGCFVKAGDHAQHYPTGDGPVIDATGAGDAFDGAFLARYLRDGDLAGAARFANDIGSWVVARYGARPPIDDELRAILKRS
ncbi:MAG TPA: sugar kinase [Kouleothrix sp.]|uniref:carbohydrate kinase family protein n=1 Tax=Kouleothrix sp. TaxID=2779161 RepID=UPI002B7B6458|nr:sugar kinase [Kouleothrix sp.]HRC74392.1 sugar kinase [Kouleothrix sp.]